MNKHHFNNILAALSDEVEEQIVEKLEKKKGVYVFPEPYRPAIAVKPIASFPDCDKLPRIVTVEKIELVDPDFGDYGVIITVRNEQGTEEHIDIKETFITEAERLSNMISDEFVDNEFVMAFWKQYAGTYKIPKTDGSHYDGLPDHDGETVTIDADNLTVSVAKNGETYTVLQKMDAWQAMLKIIKKYNKKDPLVSTAEQAVIDFYAESNFDLPF